MKEKIANKKFLITFFVILLISIFIIFFIKNNYKNFEIGNNMSNKSIEEIEEYILNISSYEATVQVTIESNRNTNKYVISQQYISPNKSKQIVLEPSNIEGLEIEYDGQKLSINNTRLNLSKIYENYEYVVGNFLNLESFIEDYKSCKEQGKTILYEENNEFVLEVEQNNNKYVFNKKLYIIYKY